MCANRQVPLLFEDIAADPMNAEYTSRGWEPVYSASARSRIILVGQAPGRIAQETRIPWNDVSGRLLRTWLSVSDDVSTVIYHRVRILRRVGIRGCAP